MNRREIESLFASGIITEEQRNAIIAKFVQEPEKNLPSPNRTLVFFLGTIAALMIVSGALVLIVSHWQEITPLAKTLSGIVIMLLAWWGSSRLRKKKPIVSEGLGLLGTGMWGVNIILHGILFEPGNPAVEAFFVFFAGIIAVPFLVKQRLLIGIVALCSFILLALMLNAPESSWLSLADLKHTQGGTVIAIIAGMLLIWWLVGEKCRRHVGVYEHYYWITPPCFIIFLSLVQTILLYDWKHLSMGTYGWLAPLSTLLILLALKPKQAGWLCWLALTGWSCALIPIAVHLSWHPEHREVIGLTIGCAYAISLGIIGARSHRQSWINYSALMMIFVFIYLLVRIKNSFSDSGLLLMATGLAVLVFAFLLEGQRRRLINKVKQPTLPPIPENCPPAEKPELTCAQEGKATFLSAYRPNMKTRAFLIMLLITAQTAWLAWQFYAADSELSAAPRIRVNVLEPTHSTVFPDLADCTQHPEIDGRVCYHMDAAALKAYRSIKGSGALHLSMEIALRQNHAPLATQLFINGVPLPEALEAMKKGVIPQGAEKPHNSQSNETQGH